MTVRTRVCCSVLLDLQFPVAVYKKLLHLPVGLDDVKEVRRG